MNIKRATKDHIKPIFNLEKIWEKEKINYGIYIPKERLNEIKEEIKKQIYYVLEHDKKIIGFIQGEITKSIRGRPSFDIKKNEKYGEIHGAYLLKEFRGNKFGHLLLQEIFKEFKRLGIKKVVLKSTSKNVHGLVSYYKKLGFEERLVDMVKNL